MREYFAQVFLAEIEEFGPTEGKMLLDVGGAKGEFCQLLHQLRSCQAVNLEPMRVERLWPNGVRALADRIPFPNDVFDLVICRGVMEHIPTEVQQTSLNEMYRVTRQGGLCYILIPPWFNPHAGHSLKPFHIFPFKVAKFLRQLVFRKRIKANSLAECGLYPITFSRMTHMIRASGFRLVATRDTHFRMHFMTQLPILNEILVPAAAFILMKDR
jgi:SAM-dependent methyltransferase